MVAVSAIVLALTACGGWLFSDALMGGDKVLAGDDLLLFVEPMSASRPPEVTRPANPLSFDSAHVFHPDMIAAREAVRSGRLPGWTDSIAAGRPLLAAQQAAPLYPTNVPAYVLPYWDSLEVTALVKVLLAAMGMALFCVSLGLRAPAALLGGLAFGFSTYFIGWLAHPHTNVYLLLPWIALSVRRTVRGRSALATAGLGGVLGIALLGGHAPSVLLIALLVVPYALFEVMACEARRARFAAIGLLTLAVLLGIAAGGAMLLPLVEGLSNSTDSSSRGGQTLPWSVVNAFFFPELWGRPDKIGLPGGPSNFQERTGYFGAVALLLAVAGLVRRPTREQTFFLVAGAVAGGLAFLPPLAEAFDRLPGYASANLSRALVLVTFCGAVLAAFGLQRLLETDRRTLVRMSIAAGLVTAVVGGQWVLRNANFGGSLRAVTAHLPVMDGTRLDAGAIQLAVVLRWLMIGAVVTTALAIAAWRPRLASTLAIGLLVVAMFDLVTVGRGYQPAVSKSTVDTPVPPSIAVMREAEQIDGSRSAGEGFTYPANLSSRFGTHDPREHELPTVERYHRTWHALRGTGVGTTLQRKMFWASPPVDGLLDLFAVRWLYSPTLAAKPRAGYRRVPGFDSVFENVDAFPRAWVAYSWRRAANFDVALAKTVASPGARLRDSPVIEGVENGFRSRIPATPARTRWGDPDEVLVEVNASRGGYVVLTDTFYPGWRATVDGRETPIEPANGAFRAVKVDAGRHEIRFTYASATVRWGWTVSLLAFALLTVAVIIVAIRRRRRKRRAVQPS